MSIRSGTYSKTIALQRISYPLAKQSSRAKDTDYYTVHPVFGGQIDSARSRLKQHFANRSKDRPLNCLVLGAAGSGKSYLVRQLIRNIVDGESFFDEFNLSQCGSIADIKVIFERVTELNSKHAGKPGVIFFDEFDIRISGASAIQALISPIYDRRDFKNIAFIFTGSYLKNRRMLDYQLDNAAEFDLRRLISTLRVYTDDEHEARSLADLDEVIWRLETRPLRDPDENVLEYLAGLEKLTDFRSRINGFIIELPDLDSPLDVTTDRFCITSPAASDRNLALSPQWEPYLPEYINALEPSNRPYSKLFTKIDGPMFELQDIILRERFWRVIICLMNRIDPNEKTAERTIKRSLLNYLTVIPLRYGMRSLEYMIGLLIYSNGVEFHMPTQQVDMLPHHIRELNDFKSPEAVWKRMQERNSTLTGKNMGGHEKIKLTREPKST